MQTALAKHVGVLRNCTTGLRRHSPGRTGEWQKHVGPTSSKQYADGSHETNSAQHASSNPADALTETLGGISAVDGRVASGNNLVLGGDDSLEKWRELDAKVNKYPTKRTFKAIGSGGDDFVSSMVEAVREACGNSIDVPSFSRPSTKGNYISATVGPVMMQSSEQVVEVYARMREDSRLKWYL